MSWKNLLFFIAITIALLLIIFSSEKNLGEEEAKTENKSKEKIEEKGIAGKKVLGEMVLLSGGTFWMGLSEKEAEKMNQLGRKDGIRNARQIMEVEMPRHKVTLKAFYIDKYEVTNQEFAAFVNETGYRPQANWVKYNTKGREDHPVVALTWYDANAYAKWAGKRLPTEAEWEFAARGVSEQTLFPWGNKISKDLANYSSKQSYAYSPINTMEIGNYPANSFGLYDVAGNAGEWCADWYDEGYYSASPEENPTGPDQGENKVVRGGAWGTPAFYLRVASRGSFNPKYFDHRIGFRCARSLD